MNAGNQGNAGVGLTSEQLAQLNSRFKCKTDLYRYMDRVLQILLPKEKNCSVQVSATHLHPHLPRVDHALSEEKVTNADIFVFIVHASTP